MHLNFSRYKLGHFPTPIEYLRNISNHLSGPKIYIKRDDCTGLATGGNKTRKLEYLMPDAIKNKATLIVTVGAVQSNHARQTAAACAILNIKCLIILEQRLKNAPQAYKSSGNVFLDKIFGAEIITCPAEKDVTNFAQQIIKEKKNEGEIPYYIPVGGSNEIGELGYIECIREIIQDQKKDNFIGGAGIVSQHLRAAGAKVTFSTVLGDDDLKDFVGALFAKDIEIFDYQFETPSGGRAV